MSVFTSLPRLTFTSINDLQRARPLQEGTQNEFSIFLKRAQIEENEVGLRREGFTELADLAGAKDDELTAAGLKKPEIS
jgi:hypothetical protein